jgi:hypothetical protein
MLSVGLHLRARFWKYLSRPDRLPTILARDRRTTRFRSRFTEAGINSIGELTTSDCNPQHCPITNLSIPTASSFVSGIAPGPFQDMWFAEENATQISELR